MFLGIVLLGSQLSTLDILCLWIREYFNIRFNLSILVMWDEDFSRDCKLFSFWHEVQRDLRYEYL